MDAVRLQHVDNILRNGRIGEILLKLYNIRRKTRLQLRQVQFVAFKGETDGQARVGVDYNGDLYPVLVGSLHLYLNDKLTDKEESFFRGINIGWH